MTYEKLELSTPWDSGKLVLGTWNIPSLGAKWVELVSMQSLGSRLNPSRVVGHSTILELLTVGDCGLVNHHVGTSLCRSEGCGRGRWGGGSVSDCCLSQQAQQ